MSSVRLVSRLIYIYIYIIQVESNHLIIRQGAIANHFFIIYSGVVRIIKQVGCPCVLVFWGGVVGPL